MRLDLKGFVIKHYEFPDAVHGTSTFCSFQRGSSGTGGRKEGHGETCLLSPSLTHFPSTLFCYLRVPPFCLQQLSASEQCFLRTSTSFCRSATLVRILTCGTVFKRLLNDSAVHLASDCTTADRAKMYSQERTISLNKRRL